MKLMRQELELWYIVPALRREFAIEMRRRGVRGVEIARRLGLTKAAVSQYFSKSRAAEFRFDRKTKGLIADSVSKVVNGADSLVEIQRIVDVLRNNAGICRFHKKKEHIAEGCNICFRYAK